MSSVKSLPHGDENKKLLQLLREKDKRTLKQLYDDCFPLMYRAIHEIVRNDETAEELADDSFMKFLQAIETKEPDNVKGFLRVIARNIALDHYRKESRENSRKEEYQEYHVLQRPAEVEEAEDALWEELWLRLKKLSSQRRKILEARFKYKKNIEVIAQEMGLAEQTVRNQLNLAIKHLRRAASEDSHLFWTVICVLGEEFLK